METKALLIIAALCVQAGQAQAQQADGLRTAGACARCHISAVLEWDVSKHPAAGTSCVACHGESKGHVLDERNTVKPDRVPRGPAVAQLCTTCHKVCPKTQQATGCQDCHHVHALMDVRKPSAPPSPPDQSAELFRAAMAKGDALLKNAKWREARDEFESARRIRPTDPVAAARIELCRRRMNPSVAGFRILSDRFDPQSGLPLSVETSSVGIAMALIPEADTMIGGDAGPDSRPAHSVHIRAFYLGRYEISQAQWTEVMGSNPSHNQGATLPVENVSWLDAVQFIERLNARIEGGGFRLPTEAEWERAARLGTAASEAAAWHRENSGGQTKPVGSKAGVLGFHDLHGNVWEWCSTLFRSYPYNPHDGREDVRAKGLRVLRGGGYADSADMFKPGLRFSDRPERRLPANGLRLARTVPPLQ